MYNFMAEEHWTGIWVSIPSLLRTCYVLLLCTWLSCIISLILKFYLYDSKCNIRPRYSYLYTILGELSLFTLTYLSVVGLASGRFSVSRLHQSQNSRMVDTDVHGI